jgi:type IV pilus assembly protein PilN
MRITLNLASRPFTDLGPAIKRLRIGMGILAGLSLLLLLGLHAVHRKALEARARDNSLDGAISQINNERQGYHALMRQPQNARFLQQVLLLNQLFGEKAFSWTLAMENLETVLPGGVQVTQIEPARGKNGQITLHLRVLGPHNLGDDLVRNLEHSHRFISPRIEGETAESSTNSSPNRALEPVSASNKFDFDLLADYVPPTPEERAAIKGTPKKDQSAAEQTPGQPGNLPSAGRHVPAGSPALPRRPYTGAGNSGARNPAPRPNPGGYPGNRVPNPQGGPQ